MKNSQWLFSLALLCAMPALASAQRGIIAGAQVLMVGQEGPAETWVPKPIAGVFFDKQLENGLLLGMDLVHQSRGFEYQQKLATGELVDARYTESIFWALPGLGYALGGLDLGLGLGMGFNYNSAYLLATPPAQSRAFRGALHAGVGYRLGRWKPSLELFRDLTASFEESASGAEMPKPRLMSVGLRVEYTLAKPSDE